MKKTISEDTRTPSAPNLSKQKTAGIISMDEDDDRLVDLYTSLEEQFQYYLDKEFQFPTNKADLIESPDQPILKFEIFYEFYRSAMIWNKILIMQKKHDNTKLRRRLFKEGNKETDYMKICLQYSSQDEACLQEIIERFLNKMGMQESDFQRSMLRHMSDVGKMKRIQESRQEIEEGQFDYP